MPAPATIIWAGAWRWTSRGAGWRGDCSPGAAAGSAALAAERDRLDGEISDLIAWARSADARGDVAAATALLRQHVHDELTREMKMTRKPLFAEISKATAGGQAKIQDKSQN